MSYINACTKYGSDDVFVWIREDGNRFCLQTPGEWSFYYPKKNGEFLSYDDVELTYASFNTRTEYKEAREKFKKQGVTLYESDVGAELKYLSEHFYQKPSTPVNITFFDIEVAYQTQSFAGEHKVRIRALGKTKEKEITVEDLRLLSMPDLAKFEVYDVVNKAWVIADISHYLYEGVTGFPKTEEVEFPVNSIAVYHQWCDKTITISIPPTPRFTLDDIDEDVKESSEIILCATEEELLKTFLQVIEDSDIVSGWNSSVFDVPYLKNRIDKILGAKWTHKLTFPEAPKIRERKVEIYHREVLQMDIQGRVYFDYLELYRKYMVVEKASYKLESIAEEHCPELPKLKYEGSLARLYYEDYSHFLRYNIRDTIILKTLEQKLGFINVAVMMYRMSCGLPKHCTGTIKLAEMSIVNYCIHELNKRVPDMVPSDDVVKDGKIEGAFVINPQSGMHEYIASVDVTSLYPSCIRAINISPETIVGQFIERQKAVDHIHNETDEQLSFTLPDGNVIEVEPSDFKQLMREEKWALSGYGTVFDQTNQGIVPSVLEDWFNKRLEYKGKMKDCINKQEAILAKYSS
jgi:DNA polymerase elongation subunit (family B)